MIMRSYIPSLAVPLALVLGASAYGAPLYDLAADKFDGAQRLSSRTIGGGESWAGHCVYYVNPESPESATLDTFLIEPPGPIGDDRFYAMTHTHFGEDANLFFDMDLDDFIDHYNGQIHRTDVWSELTIISDPIGGGSEAKFSYFELFNDGETHESRDYALRRALDRNNEPFWMTQVVCANDTCENGRVARGDPFAYCYYWENRLAGESRRKPF